MPYLRHSVWVFDRAVEGDIQGLLGATTVTGKGTGLANVRERLRLFYGANAEMRLLPQGVELRLPGEPEQESGFRPQALPDHD